MLKEPEISQSRRDLVSSIEQGGKGSAAGGLRG
jgi:hypothetical protein